MPPSIPICPTALKLARSLHTLPPSLRQTILLRTTSNNTTSPAILAIRPFSHTHKSSSQQPTLQTSTPNEPEIPAPTRTSGPLLERLPNRALPTISRGLTRATKLWLYTLPLFLFLCAAGSLSIFNYQKTTSSTVNSILYALRTSPKCREILGDEIYFASQIPWIKGELNQLHGNIDISFWVKGKKAQGLVRFVSVRARRDGYFETLEWSLSVDRGDGKGSQVYELLDMEGRDPMGGPSMQRAVGELKAEGAM